MTIKQLREVSGMTQKAFSEYFSIPKRSIENWEGVQRQCPAYLLELMEYKLRNEGIISDERKLLQLDEDMHVLVTDEQVKTIKAGE